MFKNLLFGIMIKGEKILIQTMNPAFVFMLQKEKKCTILQHLFLTKLVENQVTNIGKPELVIKTHIHVNHIQSSYTATKKCMHSIHI